jgi:hypothetical protein
MSDRDRAVFPVRDLPVPHLRRWVLFVDGENLTLRAQQLARDTGVRLSEGPFYSRDTFVWIACWPGVRGMEAARSTIPLQAAGIRAYYYTSVVGNEEKIRSAKEALYEMQFKPKVFRRSKTRGSKAVDLIPWLRTCSGTRTEATTTLPSCALGTVITFRWLRK